KSIKRNKSLENQSDQEIPVKRRKTRSNGLKKYTKAQLELLNEEEKAAYFKNCTCPHCAKILCRPAVLAQHIRTVHEKRRWCIGKQSGHSFGKGSNQHIRRCEAFRLSNIPFPDGINGLSIGDPVNEPLLVHKEEACSPLSKINVWD